MGIHGSIALQMHAPESDIDFVVYGTENFRLVEEAIARLVNAGKLTYIVGNRIEAARKFQGRYQGKIFMYNATKKPEQIKEKYGAYRYVPLDPVSFEATVCDDTETMYRPAVYNISGYKPQDDQSELDLDKIPIQVVSNIGLYRNVASSGSTISVSGKLERVESTTPTRFSIKWLLEQLLQRKNTFGQYSLTLRDRDAIETAEGLIFRVFGYSHPSRRLHLRRRVCFIKNFPVKRPPSAADRQRATLLQILQRRRHETRHQKVPAVPGFP